MIANGSSKGYHCSDSEEFVLQYITSLVFYICARNPKLATQLQLALPMQRTLTLQRLLPQNNAALEG